MGDTKNLVNREAIDKIRDFAKDKMCFFCTFENKEINTRPMSTRGVDEDGTMWFFSRKDSNKNRQIRKDQHVLLLFSDEGHQHYLSIEGQAEEVIDKEKTEELWNMFIKAWFDEGKEDPALTLIRFTPQQGHYWDTKDGKLVYFLKTAVAAVTGKEDADGTVEGEIQLAEGKSR